jgi:hypothetical protein
MTNALRSKKELLLSRPVPDHLSERVHGVPCGSIELQKSRNRLSKRLYGWPWETSGTYMS